MIIQRRFFPCSIDCGFVFLVVTGFPAFLALRRLIQLNFIRPAIGDAVVAANSDGGEEILATGSVAFTLNDTIISRIRIIALPVK